VSAGGASDARSVVAANLAAVRALLPPDHRGVETDALGSVGYRLLVAEEVRPHVVAALATADETIHVAVGRAPAVPATEVVGTPELAAARSLRVHLADPGNGAGYAAELYFGRARADDRSSVGRSPWGASVATRDLATGTVPAWSEADQVTFPIDLVYTWVDGGDPRWIARRDAARGRAPQLQHDPSAADVSRFRSRDELRYSLRSVERYAPFVRKVFLVTDGQRPAWLVDDHPQLEVVDHREFLPEEHLPLFNSRAIEARLHHVPGLAEHYLYLNDDFLFGRPVRPELFFSGNGVTHFFPSTARIRPGPATPEDTGIDATARNGRDLIARLFGPPAPEHKFKHTPHANTRTRTAEIESRIPDELARTVSHPFRHHTDVSLPSAFAHHYGWRTGTAVPSRIRYAYLFLGEDPSTVEARLAALLEDRSFDVLCLNDGPLGPEAAARVDALVASFLDRYLPFRSSFEVGDEVGA
jgi:hypothetical protein